MGNEVACPDPPSTLVLPVAGMESVKVLCELGIGVVTLTILLGGDALSDDDAVGALEVDE